MEGKQHFCAAVSDHGELNFEEVQAEVIAVVQELVTQNPHVMSILFECMELPPYATAVQHSGGLPVFDITTLIGHVHSGLVRKTLSSID
jgi:hypothetical protein